MIETHETNPRMKYLNPVNYLLYIYSFLPPERKTNLLFKGFWKLAARKLIAPFLQFKVTLVLPNGTRVVLSEDPVDEVILGYLVGRYRLSYFPPVQIDLPSEPLILDLGAHHGFFAVFALSHYPNSKIICVEPDPNSIDLIRLNLESNGWTKRARIIQAALAPCLGTGLLKFSQEGSWANSLFERNENASRIEEVSTKTLSAILDGKRPHIVKCNAEGAEFEFVKQLQNLDWRPMLMSIAVHREFGDMNWLVNTLVDMGYATFRTGTQYRPVFHFCIKSKGNYGKRIAVGTYR